MRKIKTYIKNHEVERIPLHIVSGKDHEKQQCKAESKWELVSWNLERDRIVESRLELKGRKTKKVQ